MGDHSYSPDVEIDDRGKLVYARDIERGEVISIPSHMMKQMRPQRDDLKLPNPRP